MPLDDPLAYITSDILFTFVPPPAPEIRSASIHHTIISQEGILPGSGSVPSANPRQLVSWTTRPTAPYRTENNRADIANMSGEWFPVLHKANSPGGELFGFRKLAFLDDGVLVWPIATIPGVRKVALFGGSFEVNSGSQDRTRW
ncbi:hypothetical protein MBM_03257 [Drepanopeziza brunnea f. sp. 'multigermtubi' MB_m1]|uniref:Uncharacterized protein n=1 Tax=Marssonina brunnea f. sp. multigermtubi (strain MB_m1) TaxID=1072389 RepID=K1XZL3_MARBU|nr:uncharacterized protein MBM_03257 [Drepanopeziza brunnea f. sp. 'multigermtubi' MB_m1]EKD18264.1 hypothetical protein MBM_03257 [Drepanopeziza brunnea f. sp. 'multigermtubi' MB_m1]